MRKGQQVIASSVENRIVTEEDLLNAHNIALEKWRVIGKDLNSWETTLKDKEGNILVTPNYQVKLKLDNRDYKKEVENLIQELKEDFKKQSPIVPKKRYSTCYKKLLQINIFDLHLGKISWKEEVGASYNLKIAKELFLEAVLHFKQVAIREKVERILFPIGNDFFNADKAHPFNSTTKGTPQEEDVRWQEVFRTGRQIVIQAIDELQEIAPVDVIMVPGNHDYERNFYLGDTLECWYYNNKNVTIVNTPSPRKYYKYGQVLLGFTHGNEEKITDLPNIMAQEVPKLWGDSQVREFHLGHIHSSKSRAFLPTTELQGTVIRHMSSLTGTDSWHHKKGYVRNRRAAEAYLWDYKGFLEGIRYFNIQYNVEDD